MIKNMGETMRSDDYLSRLIYCIDKANKIMREEHEVKADENVYDATELFAAKNQYDKLRKTITKNDKVKARKLKIKLK